MGPELGVVYHELSSALIWLITRWRIHRELYGTSERTFEVLNHTAPFFFFIVQDTLWGEILLSIARLTDPVESCGKSNLCVHRLPALISDSSRRVDIEAAVTQAAAACAFARDWRNRWLAHTDLQLATSIQHASPLPPADVQPVDDALTSLEALLNTVAEAFGEHPVAYRLVEIDHGGVEDLVRYLKGGWRVEQGRFASEV